jgi:hypothetical protein
MNEHRHKNWWGRNWKWVVPVGGIGALALFAAVVFAVFSLIFGVMKSSVVYKDAVARAKGHSSVQEILGSPIEEGWLVTGNINVSGSSGEADLDIPISGSEGKAKIYVVAEKSGEEWTYLTLVVEIKETGQRFDLLK